MLNKKELVILSSFVFAIILLVSFVSPAGNSGYYANELMSDMVDMVVGFFEPFLTAVFGAENFGDLYLFERFLLFIILVALIYFSLERAKIFKKTPQVLWIIAIAIPLIAIRTMDFEWLHTILVQYEILGIALTSVLPFIIYFFFLHYVLAEYSTMRKIGWVLFAVIYFIMTYTMEDIHSEVYFWTAVASLVLFFADGTIHRYLVNQRIKEVDASAVRRRIADIGNELDKVMKSNHLNEDEKREEARKLKETMAWYRKQL